MKNRRPFYLGIKLSEEEYNAVIALAQLEGLQKSSYARRVLRHHLIGAGEIKVKVNNPAPQVDDLTTGVFAT